jgi:hypothetical protein
MIDLSSSETDFLRQLSASQRLLLLGRAATAAHGGPFLPHSYEVWSEPLASASAWAKNLHHFTLGFLQVHLSPTLSVQPLSAAEVAECVTDSQPVCVRGFDTPILIHRIANEFRLDEFDRVWQDSQPIFDQLSLPSLMDTFLNKINSRRASDYEEMVWLEEQVRHLFSERLPICDVDEANRLLERYIDPESLRHALLNPNHWVQKIARNHLKSFADSGDPYSQQILELH